MILPVNTFFASLIVQNYLLNTYKSLSIQILCFQQMLPLQHLSNSLTSTKGIQLIQSTEKALQYFQVFLRHPISYSLVIYIDGNSTLFRVGPFIGIFQYQVFTHFENQAPVLILPQTQQQLAIDPSLFQKLEYPLIFLRVLNHIPLYSASNRVLDRCYNFQAQEFKYYLWIQMNDFSQFYDFRLYGLKPTLINFFDLKSEDQTNLLSFVKTCSFQALTKFEEHGTDFTFFISALILIYIQIHNLLKKKIDIFQLNLISITLNRKMCCRLRTIIICLLHSQVISHFFHFDNFLEPILNPLTQKTVRFNSKHPQSETTTITDPLGQIETPQEKNKKKKPINRSSQDFYGRKKDEKYVMVAEDHLAKDLYEMLGIPEDIIYKKFIPVHMEARHDLNCYFYKGSNSKHKLYESLVELKDIIDWVFENYLKNYKSLIIGDDNVALGSHIFLFADNHTILGNQDIVFNTQYPEDVMRGDNIVRVGSFDISLEKLQLVNHNPYDAITLLD